jgi:hydroxymethylbilane synthase
MASSKEISVHRKAIQDFVIPKDTNALWIAKGEALSEKLQFSGILWCAGLITWKKLADQGYWIEGCAEGLGEDEDPCIETLTDNDLHWAKLTHADAPVEPRKHLIATYQISLSSEEWKIGAREAFYWHSSSQFLAALSKDGALKNKKHACGPGNTYKVLREHLGPAASIEIYLNEEDWRKSCTL